MRRRAALCLLALLLLGGYASAWAHAELLDASPMPGEIFRWQRPSQVTLRFSQQVVAEGSQIDLIRTSSKSITTVPLGAVEVDPADPHRLRAALPALEPGRYTVAWRTLSVDGHTLEGSYEFEVHFRAQLITLGVALIVFSLMALLVYVRRARPEDEV